MADYHYYGSPYERYGFYYGSARQLEDRVRRADQRIGALEEKLAKQAEQLAELTARLDANDDDLDVAYDSILGAGPTPTINVYSGGTVQIKRTVTQ